MIIRKKGEFTSTSLYDADIGKDELVTICKKLLSACEMLQEENENLYTELEKQSERIHFIEECLQDNKLNIDRLRL